MDDTDRQRAELFVRTLAPPGATARQNDVVDRLAELERTDVVDQVDLTVWGDSVPVEGSCTRVGTGAYVAAQIRAFRRWCDARDASLDPYFTRSTVESSITGETYDRVVPPHRCLAVYEGERVLAVYPCSIGGESRSVEDGLRALETRRTDEVNTLEPTEELD